MAAGLFEDEMMGPEHAAKQADAQALLGGEGADYDAFSRRGSFAQDADFDDEPMRRGSVGPGADAFYAQRPLQEPVGVSARAGRVESMRRAGATSLEPMAFARERAGTVVGAQDSPWSPNIHRDGEHEETLEDWADARAERNPGADRLAMSKNIFKDRMDGSARAIPGRTMPERDPLTADDLQEEAEKLDYQHDESKPSERYLSQDRHWQFWDQAHPEKPNRGAFMSKPDAGWDRVTSRGFLGVPWLFSMLGSKLFGTKGGRYDRRKEDLARRNGTFERAWETYGSNAHGKRGVQPKWMQESAWGRLKWAGKQAEFGGGVDEVRRPNVII